MQIKMREILPFNIGSISMISLSRQAGNEAEWAMAEGRSLRIRYGTVWSRHGNPRPGRRQSLKNMVAWSKQTLNIRLGTLLSSYCYFKVNMSKEQVHTWFSRYRCNFFSCYGWIFLWICTIHHITSKVVNSVIRYTLEKPSVARWNGMFLI